MSKIEDKARGEKEGESGKIKYTVHSEKVFFWDFA